MASEKNFITQLGFGCDQHGHNDDCTNAAIKAVKNAISNNCLVGLSEICGLKEPKDLLNMKVYVKIGAPYPENIDKKKILKAIPFGEKSIEVVKGGLVAKGVMIKELGDTSDKIILCNAAVTVSVISS
ncbi:MAG: Lin0512 family protein [Promethearchaeota archaeon]